MPPRLINYNESLDNYYRYIMDYLDRKYDHRSVEPAYTSQAKEAELHYYEAQARQLVAQYERQAAKGTPENPYTPAEWRAAHK